MLTLQTELEPQTREESMMMVFLFRLGRLRPEPRLNKAAVEPHAGLATFLLLNIMKTTTW